ncbi:transposable element tc3 transposase [Trichonephila clavipes]|nr:transposable element tc3 transposase [Trichonephila clavipes]
MIMKFEETGNLDVLHGRGRKLVATETVEEVATAMVERASNSIFSSASGRSVTRIGDSVVDNEAVNTQSYRIWGTSTPNTLHQRPLHSDYVTAWCRFTAEFILGHFFFEILTPQGPERCSVTSPRYRELLQQQVIPALQERQCLQTTIFMQDGATPHIARQVKALLSVNLGDNHVTSRHFPDARPSRSPDLNPCDFWLWRFLKCRVYSGGIRTFFT